MCTSFAVYHQKKAVYGMNFDTDEIDLKLIVNSYHDCLLYTSDAADEL